ncbi:hypothetical protein Y032_0629g840 [Ancylostoma ceylanicum]|uniref:Uncharacterized protein n=1 Tax=Ancylostoma ceylanicum TaxID=53326 RepID=A0A016WKD8_9BILA|nr:hypothetical protein Y032_0629g840 [Ancylostoma ceylanicum]
MIGSQIREIGTRKSKVGSSRKDRNIGSAGSRKLEVQRVQFVGLHLDVAPFFLLMHLEIKANCRICGHTTRASRRRVESESSLHTGSIMGR